MTHPAFHHHHHHHHAVHRAYLNGDTPVTGPIGIAVTGISDRPRPAVGRDGVRHGLLFHNPNERTALRVLPEGAHLRPRSGGIVIEPYDSLLLTDSTGGNLGEDWARVRLNTAWQVVADCDGHHGLTVWDFTDRSLEIVGNGVNRTANLLIDVEIPSPAGLQFDRLTERSSLILHPYLNRRGLHFHNPGSRLKAVSPGNIEARIGAGSVVLPPGKHFEVIHGGKIRCNTSFHGITEDACDGTLTVLEYI